MAENMGNRDQTRGLQLTVLVVDDNPIYRNGLCDLVTHWDYFNVIGAASNGSAALELYREYQPDIVLMDVDMPCVAGSEAAGRILQEYPDARIVMMTVAYDDPKLLKAIAAGACGYVLKEMPGWQLQHLLLGWARRMAS